MQKPQKIGGFTTSADDAIGGRQSSLAAAISISGSHAGL
jgi:hypothetical protein